MGGFKLLIFSCLGFLLPIVVAIKVGPQLFLYTFRHSTSLDISSNEEGHSKLTSDDNEGGSLEPMSSNRFVDSTPALDPGPDNYFVSSVIFRVTSLPRVGKRQKLIGKYQASNKPGAGWAIVLRRLSTSTRPEVYWQSADGKGGWFTFERFRFLKDRFYALTMVSRPGDFMSLYVEEIKPDEAKELAQSEQTTGGIFEDEPGAYQERVSGPQFLGGYTLGEVNLQSTDARLEFAPRVVDAGEFRGEVTSVLVARPAKLPKNREKLQELLTGGPLEFASRFDPNEVALLVKEDGVDYSTGARAVRSERNQVAAP